MRRLGVNVDHVATLRQARGTSYPSPLHAAQEAVRAGAHQITVHLREDRRHIQEDDVHHLKKILTVPLNLEMAVTPAMTAFALSVRPHTVTLVPERRQELTTEGGLDLSRHGRKMAPLIEALNGAGIRVSAFIEAVPAQVSAARQMGCDGVEFHTGHFCERYDARRPWKQLLKQIQAMSRFAKAEGLLVFAGHGINEINIAPLLQIEEIEEYNIGHSIVAEAVMVGFYEAVKRMRKRIESS